MLFKLTQCNGVKYKNHGMLFCLGFHVFWLGIRVMVFNATFNNSSVISWLSVLLVEESGVPGENHRPVASHWQTLSHNVVSSTPHLSRIRLYGVFMNFYSHTGKYYWQLLQSVMLYIYFWEIRLIIDSLYLSDFEADWPIITYN
jgi:hypothetical protein